MKTHVSRFDSLVARYYPAVYAFAVKMTGDPREAVNLTRAAFRSVEKQIVHLKNKTTIVNTLLGAVLRAGLVPATA